MCNYHLYECDRCLKTEVASELPRYWGTLVILDKNRPEGQQQDSKDFCQRCMERIQDVMAVIPRQPSQGEAREFKVYKELGK